MNIILYILFLVNITLTLAYYSGGIPLYSKVSEINGMKNEVLVNFEINKNNVYLDKCLPKYYLGNELYSNDYDLDDQSACEFTGTLDGFCKKSEDINNNDDEDIYRKYCLNCSDNKKNGNEGCEKCPYIELLNKIKILSSDETLDEIIYHNKSIVRYGDGEFNILNKRKRCSYQRINGKLSERLKEVLQSNEEGLLIGISDSINTKNLKKLNGEFRGIFKRFVYRNKFSLLKLLDRNKQYYSANISRFYIYYKNRSQSYNYVKKLKKLWNNRDILIVEGEQTRLGVNNDLFNNTRSIERILCPTENAFNVYDKIVNETVKNDRNKLVLISLGPTATVLAYDLYKQGFQAIDIGHVDVEYEWFLKGARRRTKLANKYVNGVRNGSRNIQAVEDETYYSQIIAKIKNSPRRRKRYSSLKLNQTPKEHIKSNKRPKRRHIKRNQKKLEIKSDSKEIKK